MAVVRLAGGRVLILPSSLGTDIMETPRSWRSSLNFVGEGTSMSTTFCPGEDSALIIGREGEGRGDCISRGLFGAVKDRWRRLRRSSGEWR